MTRDAAVAAAVWQGEVPGPGSLVTNAFPTPPEQVAACQSMREFLYNVDFTDKFWTPVDAASRFCDHFADGQSGTA